MTDYKYHLFFCTNQRIGRGCCEAFGASALRDYAKAQIKALGLAGPGGIRINTAGCLGRCGEGPVIVIYPEGIWYTYSSREDIDEIIREHLQAGRSVERLRLTEEPQCDA